MMMVTVIRGGTHRIVVVVDQQDMSTELNPLVIHLEEVRLPFYSKYFRDFVTTTNRLFGFDEVERNSRRATYDPPKRSPRNRFMEWLKPLHDSSSRQTQNGMARQIINHALHVLTAWP